MRSGRPKVDAVLPREPIYLVSKKGLSLLKIPSEAEFKQGREIEF